MAYPEPNIDDILGQNRPKPEVSLSPKIPADYTLNDGHTPGPRVAPASNIPPVEVSRSATAARLNDAFGGQPGAPDYTVDALDKGAPKVARGPSAPFEPAATPGASAPPQPPPAGPGSAASAAAEEASAAAAKTGLASRAVGAGGKIMRGTLGLASKAALPLAGAAAIYETATQPQEETAAFDRQVQEDTGINTESRGGQILSRGLNIGRNALRAATMGATSVGADAATNPKYEQARKVPVVGSALAIGAAAGDAINDNIVRPVRDYLSAPVDPGVSMSELVAGGKAPAKQASGNQNAKPSETQVNPAYETEADLRRLPVEWKRPASGAVTLDTAPPEFQSAIKAAVEKYPNVDPNDLARIAWVESRFNPKAYNKDSGAAGPFQFIPDSQKRFGLADPYDINASALAAARHLSDDFNRGYSRDDALYRYGGDKSRTGIYLASVNNARWEPAGRGKPGTPGTPSTPGTPAAPEQYSPEQVARFGQLNAALDKNPVAMISAGGTQTADQAGRATPAQFVVHYKDGTSKAVANANELPQEAREFNRLTSQQPDDSRPVEVIRGLSRADYAPNARGKYVAQAPDSASPAMRQLIDLNQAGANVPAKLAEQVLQNEGHINYAKAASESKQDSLTQQYAAMLKDVEDIRKLGPQATPEQQAYAQKTVDLLKHLQSGKSGDVKTERLMDENGQQQLYSITTDANGNMVKTRIPDAGGAAAAPVAAPPWKTFEAYYKQKTGKDYSDAEARKSYKAQFGKDPEGYAKGGLVRGCKGYAYGGLVNNGDINDFMKTDAGMNAALSGRPEDAVGEFAAGLASRRLGAFQANAVEAEQAKHSPFDTDYGMVGMGVRGQAGRIEQKVANQFARRAATESIMDSNMGMYAEGGVVRGPGTGTSDSIPARVNDKQEIRVSAGEYIIPADVVQNLGVKFFDDLIAKHTNKTTH